MKKLLSMLLALIMCTGWLVSCENENVTSSSESQSQSESITESESCSSETLKKPVNYKDLAHTEMEKIAIYDASVHSKNYFEPVYIEVVNGNYFPKKLLFDNYEELAEQVASTEPYEAYGDYPRELLPNDFDKSVFENNYVYLAVVGLADYGRWDYIGCYDFEYSEGFSHINVDIAENGNFSNMMAVSMLCYVLIPKESLSAEMDAFPNEQQIEVLVYRKSDK